MGGQVPSTSMAAAGMRGVNFSSVCMRRRHPITSHPREDREVAAAYCLDEDTAVLFPGRVHLVCVVHRVQRAVRIVGPSHTSKRGLFATIMACPALG
ncbi:hypothetical protein B5X24_HaOG213669 [Helicoverpa armigera]|uniref:Uncharacterized protein n=1 Tax=Helicoverpa armigera TaxID=29058 RepID=A0A2W1BD83_HELAM|nr:hypothetical protein B5X24_HaOG213669 [Helicoverpa armigera]